MKRRAGRSKKHLQTLGLIFLLAACNDSEFKGKVTAKEPAAPVKTEDALPVTSTVYIEKTAKNPVAKAFKVPGSVLDLKVDANLGLKSKDSVEVKPSLAIYFALDRSSSMGDQLESAKKSMQAFSDSLTAGGFEAKFGAVAFTDEVTTRQKLTDVASFKTYLNTVRLGNFSEVNMDYPEGGYAALTEAAKNLASEVTDPAVVPIIIYVSDALAHNGGPGDSPTRDCTSTKFVSEMNGAFGKRIKLFYSVASGAPASSEATANTCPGATVAEPYDKMMAEIAAASAMDYRGAKLNWPFNDEVLSKELPKLITEKFVQTDLVCKATAIEFSSEGKKIKSWAKGEFKEEADGTVLLKNVLADEALEGARSDSLNLKVTRCCDKEIGSECKQEQIQSVDFKIIK